MALFYRQKEDMGRLHYILKLAFERVKGDMTHLFHWINYFHKKHQEHDERFSRLERSLGAPSVTREEVRQMIELHSPAERIEKIYDRIAELHARIDKIEAQKPVQRVALKERLMRKISKNSKEYIKSVILGTIKKYGRISGPQLKEILVEEQGLCSKSSFYRLLAEIELEHDISSFTTGKEKTYFMKTQVLK
jgi:hypothetical protein